MILKLFRNYLQEIVDRIDAGDSNLSEEQEIQLISALREITRKDRDLSKYEAARYLNISRATFDNYVKSGKLPKGKKTAGFKELSWSKFDLDLCIQNIKNDGNSKKIDYSNL